MRCFKRFLVTVTTPAIELLGTPEVTESHIAVSDLAGLMSIWDVDWP